MHFRNIHINFQAIALVFLNALLVFQLNAQPPGATYYWIGNGGNWTDPNHWSSVSGGAAGTVIPGQDDAVVFDNNSFTLANQEVLINQHASFFSMDWSNITNDQVLLFDSTLYAHGDITLNKRLTLLRNVNFSGIQFIEQSIFNADSAAIDCAFTIIMDSITDSLILASDVLMSDSSSCIVFTGNLSTEGYMLKTGSLKTINNPFSGSDHRTVNISNSTLHLSLEFNSSGDTSLVFDAANSIIYLGDTADYINSLKTENLIFNDVVLNFRPSPTMQIIQGNNSYSNLIVEKGSQVYLMEGSQQTITDSLVLIGNCLDSISILSSDTITFNSAAVVISSPAKSQVECVNVRGIDVNTALTALFSTDMGNNGSNWDFSVATPVFPDLSVNNVLSSFCFGDTVYFENNSTCYSGNNNDMTFNYYFNDGSTGYYLNPPIDSTFITYESDTNRHSFLTYDSIDVVLEVIYTNYCFERDTLPINIVQPNVSLQSSNFDTLICPWTPVTFEAYSVEPSTTFQFFINGVPQNAIPSIDDTLLIIDNFMPNDTIGVLAYEAGCVSDTFPTYSYHVLNNPTFNFVSSDIDFAICEGEQIDFQAWSEDSLNTFVYQINGSSVTNNLDSLTSYSFSSFSNNDVLSVIATDANTCTDSIQQVIVVNPLPNVSLTESTGGNVICGNEQVTFTGSGADLYEFFINGSSVQGLSSNSSYFNSALTVNDTISLVGSSTFGCTQAASETFNYIVNPAPSTQLSSSDVDNTICSNEQVIFTASGAGFYEFFLNGISVQGPSTNNIYLGAGLSNNDNVSVSGTLGGCSQMSSDIITAVLQAPSTTLTNNDDGDNTICAGTMVEFTASGATNYEFFIDGVSQGPTSTQNTFETSNLQNNQVVMVQGESNSCIIAAQESFSVLVNPVVDIFSNDIDNVLCEQDPITVTGVNALDYAFWVNGVVFQSLSNDNTLTDPALPVGVDTVIVQGVSANGCDDFSQPILITVNEIPDILVVSSDADNEICQGDSVTFTSSGGDSYQFFLNGVPQGPISSNTEFTSISINDGEELLVEGSLLGCPSTSNTIAFQVNPVPNVGIQSTDVDNIFCSGDEVIFTAVGADIYQFFVGGVAQGNASSINEINGNNFTSGSYELLVVGESEGCSDNDEVNITVNELPSASLASSDLDNSICSGQNVVFTASGGNTYLFYADGVPQGALSFNNEYMTSALSQGSEISVLVNTSQGCTDSVSSGAFTVFESPNITLNSSVLDGSICSGENVEFSVSGAPLYEYFVGGQSVGVSTNNILNIDSLENAEVVYALGTSEQGCTDTSNLMSYNVFQSPVISLVNYEDSILCIDEPTQLEAFGADVYQFYVNGAPVGSFDSNADFIQVLNHLDMISVQGESNGCQSELSDAVQFTVYDYPVLNSSSSDSDNLICAQDTVFITGSGGQSFNFLLNGQLMQSDTMGLYEAYLIEEADVIQVVALNGSCASDTTSYLFSVNEMNLELSISPSNMICDGETVYLEASGGDEYQFLINGQAVGGFESTEILENIDVADFDEFSFTAYNSSTGCFQTYEDYILIHVQDSPVISPAGSLTVCEGDSVLLVSNYSYGNQWYVDGTMIEGANDTLYYATNTGNYSFEGTHGGQGDVWSIGQNASGIHGSGNNFDSSIPQIASSTASFKSIYSGSGFMVGINDLNQVYAWGENNTGQLGNGTFTSSNTPLQTPGLGNITVCAASNNSVMAIDESGGVYIWGGNTDGELGIGGNSVVNFPMYHPTLSDVDSVAAGNNHFIILKADGTVWTVGNNEFGQLGIGSTVDFQEPVLVSDLSGIAHIGAGERHSFAIDSAGRLYAWGNNSSGQLGTGNINTELTPQMINLSPVISADGGAVHSIFLKDNGEVFSCGNNSYGQLGTGGANSSIPSKIEISGVRQISAGKNTSLFNRNDNTVFGCGSNIENEISPESNTLYTEPVHMTNIHGANFINAGETSSHFIYNYFNSCLSEESQVNILEVPNAVISLTGQDTLITEDASLYQWFLDGNLIPDANLQYYVPETSGNYSVQLTSNNGCTAVSEDFYFGFGSLSDQLQALIEIYPNPAQNQLFVSHNGLDYPLRITIRDQIGKIVFRALSLDNVKVLNISNLQSGNYFITLDGGFVSNTLRFTKIPSD